MTAMTRVLPAAKHTTRAVFLRAGLDIRRVGVPGKPVTDAEYRQAMMRYNQIDVVLDVGANTGQYAMQLRAGGYRGRIVSFEPLSSAFAFLSQHVANDAAWSAHNVALGADSNESVIHVSRNSYSSSILPMLDCHRRSAPDSVYIGEERIKVTTLDEITRLTDTDRAMLKIDTQGYEHLVVAGAKRTLNRILLIECELSLVPLYSGQYLLGEMIALFSASGFRPTGFEREFSDRHTGYALQVNGFFCRA
jgi:FkbM family methyltransferase